MLLGSHRMAIFPPHLLPRFPNRYRTLGNLAPSSIASASYAVPVRRISALRFVRGLMSRRSLLQIPSRVEHPCRSAIRFPLSGPFRTCQSLAAPVGRNAQPGAQGFYARYRGRPNPESGGDQGHHRLSSRKGSGATALGERKVYHLTASLPEYAASVDQACLCG